MAFELIVKANSLGRIVWPATSEISFSDLLIARSDFDNSFADVSILVVSTAIERCLVEPMENSDLREVLKVCHYGSVAYSRSLRRFLIPVCCVSIPER